MEAVINIAFISCGKRLASCSVDRTVFLWDFDEPNKPLYFKGQIDIVKRLAKSPTDRYAASCLHDTMIKVWDAPEDF